MKLVISIVLALIAVAAAVSIVSEGVLTDGVAVATQIKGTVRVFSDKASYGRVLATNDNIVKREQIETEGKSQIELRLPDGSFMRFSENTRVLISMLKFEQKTGTLVLQAVLDSGRLWVKIKKKANPESSVEIITKTARVDVQDAVCSVEAIEDKISSISVYEGAAFVAGAAGEMSRTGLQSIGINALQQITTSAADGLAQPLEFDPKATINDWIRWNLQRDAREGLASITVAPNPATIIKNRSMQFSAVAHYPNNVEKDVTWFSTWSSSDEKTAKIDVFGAVTGIDVGESAITAAIDDIKGSAALSVSRELVSITVTPASKSVVNGAVQQFTAMGTFSDKVIRDITSSVVWKSSNPNIAFIDAAGRAVAGKSTGTAVISATFGTKSGRATLKVRRELVSIAIMPESAVVMANETQRFGAVGTYSDGTTQDLTEEAYWETSDQIIAEIDQAIPGRVIAKSRPGNAAIRASFKGKTGAATITITTAGTLSNP